MKPLPLRRRKRCVRRPCRQNKNIDLKCCRQGKCCIVLLVSQGSAYHPLPPLLLPPSRAKASGAATEEDAEDGAASHAAGSDPLAALVGAFSSGGNKEYEEEKKEIEHKKAKRQGIAAWKLGDGAAEGKAIKPWYHYGEGSAPVLDKFGNALDDTQAAKKMQRQER